MKNRKLLIGVVLVAAAAAWYAFRPERLFLNQTVNESLPVAAAAQPAGTTTVPSAPVPLASGRFHDVLHKGAGVATIYQLPDGKRVLRLTEFETSNGPDLQLYLVAAADSRDSDTVKKAGFVTLGALKGNQGDQNYDVPAGTNLRTYRSVTVWCRRFSANFATAPLAVEKN